jgi:hypothetical protein
MDGVQFRDMRIVGIGGFSKGVGKTLLVCRMLGVLPGWGVLKTSRPRGDGSAGAVPPDGSFELVTDPDALARPGRDTARYLAAGASRVLWLRSAPERLPEAIPSALARLEGLPGLLVEGNSSARFLPLGRLFLVARVGRTEIKPSAWPLVDRADAIVLNAPRLASDEGRQEAERRLRRLWTASRILVADLADPSDPALAGLLAELRDWSRWPA